MMKDLASEQNWRKWIIDDIDNELKELKKESKKITPMSLKKVILSAMIFLVLSAGLFLIGSLMNHEPGAALAMKVLTN